MRAISAVALALLCLGACSAEPEGAESGDSDALASAMQGDATPVQSAGGGAGDEEYAQLKQAAAIFAQEQFGNSPLEPSPDESGGPRIFYDVTNCGEEYENAELSTLDPREEQLELLARRVAKHGFYLSQILPPEAYREPLAEFERNYRQLIATMPPIPQEYGVDQPAWQRYDQWEQQTGALYTRLADQIEARRTASGIEGITVSAEGGCGAGEVPFSVATSPANGTVWLTTKFSFDLCGIRGHDRWNTQECRWTEIGSPEETHYLAGRYVYQASWPDGRTRRGIRSFSGGEALDTEESVRVTIAAQ